MSAKNYYKELFDIEYSYLDKMIFDNIKLLIEWKRITHKDMYNAVGLIDNKVYSLFFDEKRGFLFVPADISINDSFDTIFKLSKSDKVFNYTLYNRKDDLLRETKYKFMLQEDNIIVECSDKEYDVNSIQKIKNQFVFYDDLLLEDKPCLIHSYVKIIRTINKIKYVKQSNDEIQESFDDYVYTNFNLYDVANIIMNKEKNTDTSIARTIKR